MVIALDPDKAGVKANDEGGVEYGVEIMDNSQAAEDFLEQHPMAKIITVIDTHCNDKGDLLWKEDTKGKQNVCTLEDVSVVCCRSSPSNIPPDPEGLHPRRGV